MSVATIKLVNEQLMSTFYFATRRPEELARLYREQGQYRVQGTIAVTMDSDEAVAEEMFDLTNNPSRQSEREQLYGRYRSVSVGDIIDVDGREFLCASQGWIEL